MLAQDLVDLGCDLLKLFSLNLEGVRVEATEESLSIRVQLCPSGDDERRSIQVTRKGFSFVTFEGMTQHILLDQSSGLDVFGKEL